MIDFFCGIGKSEIFYVIMAKSIIDDQNQKQSLILPFQTRIRVFLLNAVTNASLRLDGTVNRRLFQILGSPLRVPASIKPRNGVHTSDVVVDPSRDLWFRLYVPIEANDQGQKLPVVVFFHGGGFVFLAPDFKAYDDVCRRFAGKLQAVIVSVNYRLAPEHRYPCQYDDGLEVLKFLDGGPSQVLPENADVSRCFLGGDSAGGNLAHHVAIRACQSKFAQLKVLGVLAIQPFFGGEERTPAELELDKVDPIVSFNRADVMWKAFLPEGQGMDRDHEAINVSGPNAADISNLDFPVTMVVVAGFDSLKDWQRRYYQWLKGSGKEAYLVEYPNTIHAFYVFPELPESGLFICEAKQFIQRQCSK